MKTSFYRWRLALGLLFTLALSAASAAQQIVVVERSVNLREDPSTEHPPIRLLKPPTTLDLVSERDEDGYHEVRTAEGEEGWVWAHNVRVESGALAPPAVATEFDPAWNKPPPNKSSFTGESGKCGYAGTGDEVETNWRKNRTDVPSEYNDVTFEALAVSERSNAATPERLKTGHGR